MSSPNTLRHREDFMSIGKSFSQSEIRRDEPTGTLLATGESGGCPPLGSRATS